LHGNAGGASAFGEAGGIIEQNFVRTHVDEKWRKPFEIGVERRRERIPGIGVAEIVARGESHASAIKHRAAVVVSSNGVASSGKVSPGRKERGGGGQRNASVAKSKEERKRKTATSGFSGNNDAMRRITRVQKSPVEGDHVLQGRGKAILRCQAIVRSKNVETVAREGYGDRTMCLRGAGEVATAMKIQQNVFAWRRPFDALAGDSTEMRRRDLNIRRNLIGIRTKNFAREAIIADAL
jgi:hypothetical protein